jgi:hypothetical protein
LGQAGLSFIDTTQTSMSVPFKMSQNLIILTVSINGSGPMNFVLDSGISNTIITELTGVDTVSLNYAYEITLAGLGNGEPGKAFASTGNEIILADPARFNRGILGSNHNVYILMADHFSLSKQLGMQINGLIGVDFFKSFVVEINYINRIITFYKPGHFKRSRKYRSYQELPLQVIGNKAFIEASITQETKSKIPLKLMIDTGASLPVWIAAHTSKKISIPEKTIPALLGQGLNGTIGGVNARLPELEFAEQRFKNPLVSFPDSASVSGMVDTFDRNGSLGNDILRRFNIVFNFPEQTLLIKANKDIADPFTYNQSGMEVEKPFLDLPVFTVFNIVKGSPADIAGVLPGDQITMINHVQTKDSDLDSINSILHGLHGKTIRLRINRNGEKIKVKLNIKSEI